MPEFEVSVSLRVEAEDDEDAVKQMAAWMDDSLYATGYRVVNVATGDSSFIDAEKIDWLGLSLP